jgi:hypothetical protein
LLFFGQQPIRLFQYFPGFLAGVAHTNFFGLIRLFKKVRKGDPTPAYSPVSDCRRLAALVEVHLARRVQAPMPKLAQLTGEQRYRNIQRREARRFHTGNH